MSERDCIEWDAATAEIGDETGPIGLRGLHFIHLRKNAVMAIGDQYTLRITLRCLRDDLGMPPSEINTPVTEIDHEFIRAFVEKRREHPKGNEPFVLPKHGPIADKLRWTERWRGATLYDSEENVVWLLGFGYHTSGRTDDVYEVLEGLDREDKLLPTSDDYELFLDSKAIDLPEFLRQNSKEMLREAASNPGTEVRRVIGGTFPISVVIERENGMTATWVAISYRLLHGEIDPPPEWQQFILAAFFPDRRPEDIRSPEQRLPTRETGPDEWVYQAIAES